MFNWLVVFANSSALSSSKVVSNSTPKLPFSILPNAFKRGASEKPIVSSVIVGTSIPATLYKLCNPGRIVCCNNCRPYLTKILFSPVRETKSATVPKATKSNTSCGSSSSKAAATLKATPTPDNSPKG